MTERDARAATRGVKCLGCVTAGISVSVCTAQHSTAQHTHVACSARISGAQSHPATQKPSFLAGYLSPPFLSTTKFQTERNRAPAEHAEPMHACAPIKVEEARQRLRRGDEEERGSAVASASPSP